MGEKKRVTAPAIRAMKGSRRIAMLTGYDYPTARALDAAGTDIILVGDSLGMVVLGYPDTLSVTMEDMLHHTRAVARGVEQSMIVGDMPWLSYHLSHEETLRNAGAFIRAGAQAVKIEGGKPARIASVAALRNAEIPVMGHVGLTPQSFHELGGFKLQGKGRDDARRLIDEATALSEAGCFALVLECVPAELAAFITERIAIPTIGIGAGPACDGQVLVLHDLLGLYDGHTPKFVRQYAKLKAEMEGAIRHYIDDVREGKFPDVGSESFHVGGDEELKRLYATVLGTPADPTKE
ncbi:MAG TPA: 3-methyl-2-oxobutanoate hydroxymethyltransferase [Thermoanaerobaculia bacterium]|nr:3-methyl-2-oxobutanoate hydroxymethyltransferase [Thermoanaerobaculia bacterium]